MRPGASRPNKAKRVQITALCQTRLELTKFCRVARTCAAGMVLIGVLLAITVATFGMTLTTDLTAWPESLWGIMCAFIGILVAGFWLNYATISASEGKASGSVLLNLFVWVLGSVPVILLATFGPGPLFLCVVWWPLYLVHKGIRTAARLTNVTLPGLGMQSENVLTSTQTGSLALTRKSTWLLFGSQLIYIATWPLFLIALFGSVVASLVLFGGVVGGSVMLFDVMKSEIFAIALSFLVVISGFIFFLCFSPKLGVWAAGKIMPVVSAARMLQARSRTLVARDSQSHDLRKPILLLRSFQQDGATITDEQSDVTVTFEEAVMSPLRKLGPLVAIAEPGTVRTVAGAVRERVDGDMWQQRVEQLARESAAIVLVLGETPGLAWEVGRMFEMSFLRKLVLVPPASKNQFDPQILDGLGCDRRLLKQLVDASSIAITFRGRTAVGLWSINDGAASCAFGVELAVRSAMKSDVGDT